MNEELFWKFFVALGPIVFYMSLTLIGVMLIYLVHIKRRDKNSEVVKDE